MKILIYSFLNHKVRLYLGSNNLVEKVFRYVSSLLQYFVLSRSAY